MKSFVKPPALIRLTMDGLCIMMQQKGKKGEGGTDYWEDARKLLSEPLNLLKRLERFNRDNIPESVITKMTSFLQ